MNSNFNLRLFWLTWTNFVFLGGGNYGVDLILIMIFSHTVVLHLL